MILLRSKVQTLRDNVRDEPDVDGDDLEEKRKELWDEFAALKKEVDDRRLLYRKVEKEPLKACRSHARSAEGERAREKVL